MLGTAVAACAVAACSATASSTQSATSTAPATPATSAAPATSVTATTTAPGTGAPASYPSAAWPQFDQNSARTGIAAGLPAAGPLSQKWTATLDGAVYGQPLVVGGYVIAATENDSVYALASATGKVVWRAHLGTPVPQSALNGCGDIFPLGITGTPIYDQSDGLVYAVAETSGYQHVLFGLSVTTGAVEVQRDIDVTSAANQAAYDQQRPALAIDDGEVFASFGGLAGDCGPYIGGVVGVALNGKGALTSWHTPTSREGAVWGTAGPVVGPDGDLWIANGNGAAESGDPYDGSDSVTRLGISASGALYRQDFFAPSTWADDNANDLDLGSTQPALAANDSTLIMGKRGVAYLLDTTDLGGIGSSRAQLAICKAFGAAAVSGSTVYEPCQGGGLAAISVNAEAGSIKVLWRGPADGNGSPVLGGGAVWVTAYDPSGGDSGTLYELSPATGQIENQLTIGQGLPHFSSLSLAGGSAYLGTLTGVTAVNGA